MEDMFSLGSVILWNNIQCGTDGATDGEIAELFVSKVLGSVVLKLKYEDISMLYQMMIYILLFSPQIH